MCNNEIILILRFSAISINQSILKNITCSRTLPMDTTTRRDHYLPFGVLRILYFIHSQFNETLRRRYVTRLKKDATLRCTVVIDDKSTQNDRTTRTGNLYER